MTNSQFITTLKKALAGLEKTARNDIIEEIKSHALESDTPLSEQFGSVDDLAKQYLEGVTLTKPVSAKIWGFSKKVLVGIGVLVLTLIVLSVIFSNYFSKDKFDYADENEAKLMLSNRQWEDHVVPNEFKLVIDQASTIFYWHEAVTIRTSCRGTNPAQQDDGILVIRQSHCYVYLPKTHINISVDQSQIVLVKPEYSLDITAKQASIKIAENGQLYNYDLDMQKSKFSDLESKNNADVTLKFNTVESMVSAYSY